MSDRFSAYANADGQLPDPASWQDRDVCVTGGGGFLGYHLVEQLLALGARVRVLALAPPDSHPLRSQSRVECFFGDVRDRALVQRAVAGCQVILHTAAVVGLSGPALRDMHAIGVEGTRNVLAAAGYGARIVHTSSIVAVGGTRRGAALAEDNPFPPETLGIAYVRAKRAAEEVALAAAGCQDVVVVNPGYLVGPQDYGPTEMGRFCLRVWKGRLPVAVPGGINVVDVRDVARGHLLAAEHGVAGRRYILGGEDCTWAALMRLLAQVAGLRPRWLPRLPSWLLRPVAAAATGLAWTTGKQPYPSFQHVRLGRFFWFARSDRATRELGYRPRPLLASLADTYLWFRARARWQLRRLNAWWMRPAAETPAVLAGRIAAATEPTTRARQVNRLGSTPLMPTHSDEAGL
jgi:dihydroflavonol-4-reductase